MKKQVLMAGRKRQKAIENSYYEEALMNIAYGAQLMCLIKMLGHTKEEIEAACKKVTLMSKEGSHSNLSIEWRDEFRPTNKSYGSMKP